jgi:hypothetical protein
MSFFAENLTPLMLPADFSRCFGASGVKIPQFRENNTPSSVGEAGSVP